VTRKNLCSRSQCPGIRFRGWAQCAQPQDRQLPG